MALAFKTRRVNFDSTQGIRQRQPGSVNFARPVRAGAAGCAVKGYNIRFTSGDHPIREIEIDIDSVAINGTNVTFEVDFVLRDATGNYDDAYKGWVSVLVIADLQ